MEELETELDGYRSAAAAMAAEISDKEDAVASSASRIAALETALARERGEVREQTRDAERAAADERLERSRAALERERDAAAKATKAATEATEATKAATRRAEEAEEAAARAEADARDAKEETAKIRVAHAEMERRAEETRWHPEADSIAPALDTHALRVHIVVPEGADDALARASSLETREAAAARLESEAAAHTAAAAKLAAKLVEENRALLEKVNAQAAALDAMGASDRAREAAGEALGKNADRIGKENDGNGVGTVRALTYDDEGGERSENGDVFEGVRATPYVLRYDGGGEAEVAGRQSPSTQAPSTRAPSTQSPSARVPSTPPRDERPRGLWAFITGADVARAYVPRPATAPR